jgi:hypothetical protein
MHALPGGLDFTSIRRTHLLLHIKKMVSAYTRHPTSVSNGTTRALARRDTRGIERDGRGWEGESSGRGWGDEDMAMCGAVATDDDWTLFSEQTLMCRDEDLRSISSDSPLLPHGCWTSWGAPT